MLENTMTQEGERTMKNPITRNPIARIEEITARLNAVVEGYTSEEVLEILAEYTTDFGNVNISPEEVFEIAGGELVRFKNGNSKKAVTRSGKIEKEDATYTPVVGFDKEQGFFLGVFGERFAEELLVEFIKGLEALFPQKEEQVEEMEAGENDGHIDNSEDKTTELTFGGLTAEEATLLGVNPFDEGVFLKKEEAAITLYPDLQNFAGELLGAINRVSDENKHEIRKPSVTFSTAELYDPEDEESSEITELFAKYFAAEMVGIVNAYHYQLALEELSDALIDVGDGTLTLPNLHNVVYLINGDTMFPSAMEPTQEHDYEYDLNGGDIFVDVYIENTYHDEDDYSEPVASIEIYGGVREAVYTVRDFLNK